MIKCQVTWSTFLHLKHIPILVLRSPNNFNYWVKFGCHIYYIKSIFCWHKVANLDPLILQCFFWDIFLRNWQFTKAKIAYRCLHDNQRLFNTIDLISECWDSYFSLHLLHWSLQYLQIHVEVKGPFHGIG